MLKLILGLSIVKMIMILDLVIHKCPPHAKPSFLLKVLQQLKLESIMKRTDSYSQKKLKT